MKKELLTAMALAVLTLVAAPQASYATFEVNGVMGLYFDNGATCRENQMIYTPFNIYIVYLNYQATDVKAFEAGIIVDPSDQLLFLSATYPSPSSVSGLNGDGGNAKNYLVNYSEAVALPADGYGFVLATLSVLTTMWTPATLTLNSASPSSDDSATPRPVLQVKSASNPELHLVVADLAQTAGSPNLILNPPGTCYAPTEEMSFGSIKSLYR